MWATAFYIIENFSTEIKDTDFTSKIMQVIVNSEKQEMIYLEF